MPMNLGLGLGLSRRFTFSGGVFPWTPEYVLADLDMWQDADDVSTFTFNGSRVAEWRDKSGNARHADQTTAADQPLYTAAGLNGKPVVTFASANSELLRINGTDIPDGQKTVFCVFQVSGSSRTVFSIKLEGNALRFFDCLANLGGSYRALSFLRNDGGGTSLGIGAVGASLSTAPRMVTIRYNGGPGTNPASYSADTDGNAETVGTSALFVRFSGALPALGGRYNPGVDLPLNGYIAEFIVYDGIPAADIEDRIEGYLAHKWGLTANLPAGHPYKSEPPTANF